MALVTFSPGTKIKSADVNANFSGLADGSEIASGAITAAKIASTAWTDYAGSLQWTASTTNPAIGNGTIAAAYIQLGKTVFYRGEIVMGSTTTYGSGSWSVSLPVEALAVGDGVMGSVLGTDTGTTYRIGTARASGTTSKISFYFDSANAAANATVPFTWASTDRIEWTIIYEAA